jgi:nitroreductase
MRDPRHPKIAQADHDVIDVIRERWSPRAFDARGAVTALDLLSLFEAARWAPSSGNEQPWRFVVTNAAQSPSAHEALLESLAPKNRAWAKHAPFLVLAAVRSTLERNGAPNTHAWYDAGQAVAFLTLQATAIGLAVRQMQGFDPVLARAACLVPDLFEPAVVMAVGRVGDPEALEVETHRLAERLPRQRRPITEFVFQGTWGQTPET